MAINPKLRWTAAGEFAPSEERDARSLTPWRPTVPQIREAILAWMVTAMDFSISMPVAREARQFMPRYQEVEAIAEMCHEAVLQGRLIDFGDLPNAVIKDGGVRGGPRWNRGEFPQPFVRPWLLYHTWSSSDLDNDHGAFEASLRDGGWIDAPTAALYLVNLVERDKPCGDVEVCELQPLMSGGDKLLLVCDRICLESVPDDELADMKYRAMVAPAMIRFLPGELGRMANNGASPQAAAAGNLGDPLMTALMILHTRNIERTTITVDDKLQKARQKAGKPPIPPFERVNTAPYVTDILNPRRPQQKNERGGTHKSPQPHVRLGHVRHYANGTRSIIRDTLVGVDEEARAQFRSARTHYAVKHVEQDPENQP